jgi:acyl carrier protein
MSETVIDVVKRILVSVREVDPSLVVPEAILVDDLGADSLDAIEIIMALEDHYGKELDEISVQDIRTVGDIVDLVQSLVG